MFGCLRTSMPRHAGAAVLAACMVLLAACDDSTSSSSDAAAPAQNAPPPAVGVAEVAVRDVTPSVTFNGRVEAIDKVDLRARITGFLAQRHFREGQDVKEGDPLFTIEKQQYEAAVDQAEAAVKQAQAVLLDAQLQVERGEQLLRNRNIPQAEVDQRRAVRDRAEAELMGAQAQLREAQINLGYTDIVAPIAGKIGRSVFSEGSYVGPESGPLATIVSQDPVYITFPISSRELLDAQRSARERGEDVRAVRVKVRLPDETIYGETGSVNFVDNQVDPTTDTVTIRASLPNPERRLIAGQLLGVVVEAAEPRQALVMPQAALLVDQAGPYVLVVNGESRVEQRRIKLGQQTGTDIAVERGLAEGERVIVDGLQQVRPGQPVQAADTAGRV